jgi:hypothetical protein
MRKIPGTFPFLPATLILLSILLAGLPGSARAAELSNGQTVYVSIYSHVYSGDRERPYLLTATLSLRNTDPTHPITILAADYYDSDGKLLRHYLEEPLVLPPLASSRVVVAESDRKGGSGAKFFVRWSAERKVNPPVIEGVMIGTAMQQGISFVTQGRVIHDSQ